MPTLSPAVPLDHRYRFETGGCPIEAALDAIGGRWKGLILYWICVRPHRFHELRKELPHVSQRMLVRQLRELERDGLIQRSVTAGVPAKVEYSPTDAARELRPLLVGLRNWGARHLLDMSEEMLDEHSHYSSQGSQASNDFPQRDSSRSSAPTPNTSGRRMRAKDLDAVASSRNSRREAMA